uniref:Transcription initiation factor IIE subunit beta n=1 Tax=Rhodnius prolixus TaxID=13249 RepID=T1HWQ6_RHOPR
MDPALLRERELFKKRALSTPAIQNLKLKYIESYKDKQKIFPQFFTGDNVSDYLNNFVIYFFKSVSSSSQYKFSVLAKIVKYMKTRHLEGDDHPLTLDEILDETNQLDVGSKVKQWLQTEALVNNPKIEANPEGKFLFKAPYKIRDKKGLLRLLRQHDLKGLGGIMLEDVQESLPHCEKALKSLQNEIVYIVRPIDKKKIMFYNDRAATLGLDEEFQKLWRSVAVESMDDQKIEEYLEKQGIRSMQDHGIKKPIQPQKRK